MIAASEVSGTFIAIALVVSAALILLNGLFVAYEFAVIGAKRSKFETGSNGSNGTNGAEKRSRVDRAALESLSDLSLQLAGAQLGITIASLALGRISEPALEVLIERALATSVSEEAATAIGLAISLSVFTLLHLVFGEMVPKNIALVAPETTLRITVIPYRIYLFIFRPVVAVLNAIANSISRMLGVEPRDELQSVHSVAELVALVHTSSMDGAIEKGDAELLQGALEFAQRPVVEIAQPVSETVSVVLGATVREARAAAASAPGRPAASRILVLDEAESNFVLGYMHVRDLLFDVGNPSAPVSPRLIRKMAVVRSDRSLVEALRLLRSVDRQLAVVVDEGETRGVISIEQVVRELVQFSTDATAANRSQQPAAEGTSAAIPKA